METPFGRKVQCSKCDREESLMWHTLDEGVQCNECLDSAQLALKDLEKDDEKPSVSVDNSKSPPKKSLRSTRSYRTRQNPYALPKQVAPKGKGRRQIFKKKVPVKLTSSRATCTTVTSLFYEGEAFRVGDVVAVMDKNGDTFYAQINGLMIDEYCEKSATITWLVPTRVVENRLEFNPHDYRLAFDDDTPRTMDYFSFVMHSPSEYFRNNYPQMFSKGCRDMYNIPWGRLYHFW